ncbi:hypothetical protein AFCDBAGC_3952 [Methylobacterium cerastii]|uniref:Uncharacterized protein n=1 Tax=Methylobacterium cerastii TaxID=932741 RepID=A0ABQ4QMK9_9HYPH|nr:MULTISPECIES: hypothetical protein [Methylobacterium]TXN10664.1 hypothetical protein FV219_06210 [Methylobacterium sp. WL122]TXM67001.1 hypothetical protein FV229_11285 [Methylobacterium sp. WL120]TXM72359.1 hypothetical protein FV226_12560 [Methylobacterium sp. WL12]TXN81890.1 hypothetical protein FV234_11910 [Methylobacterium sp. WL8]GJD46072.1 hypothetical protein AFCDBAGC_3952 [Methylobacterium cerastii]
MSNLEHRAAARIAPGSASVPPLVPKHIREQYGTALTRIPHIALGARKVTTSKALPAVGSFG